MPRKRSIRNIFPLFLLQILNAAAWISLSPEPTRIKYNNVRCMMSEKSNDEKLYRLLRPDVSCDANRMSGTELAYVGDVVYELFVRSRAVWPPKRTMDLQQQVIALVRGKSVSAGPRTDNEYVYAYARRPIIVMGIWLSLTGNSLTLQPSINRNY
jgi:hypothetical protein